MFVIKTHITFNIYYKGLKIEYKIFHRLFLVVKKNVGKLNMYYYFNILIFYQLSIY
jgi:hypothetical protein